MAWNFNTAVLLIPLLFLLIGLTITVVLDPYISKKHRMKDAVIRPVVRRCIIPSVVLSPGRGQSFRSLLQTVFG